VKGSCVHPQCCWEGLDLIPVFNIHQVLLLPFFASSRHPGLSCSVEADDLTRRGSGRVLPVPHREMGGGRRGERTVQCHRAQDAPLPRMPCDLYFHAARALAAQCRWAQCSKPSPLHSASAHEPFGFASSPVRPGKDSSPGSPCMTAAAWAAPVPLVFGDFSPPDEQKNR